MGFFSSDKKTTNVQNVQNNTNAADNGGAIVGGNYTVTTVNDDIVSEAMDAVRTGILTSGETLAGVTGMQNLLIDRLISSTVDINADSLDAVTRFGADAMENGRKSLETVGDIGRKSIDAVTRFGADAMDSITGNASRSIDITNETARRAIETTERAFATANQAQTPLNYNEAIKWLAGSVAVVGALYAFRRRAA